MNIKLSVYKNCLFCLPLQYGLILWGQLKLIISSLLLAGLNTFLNHYSRDMPGILIFICYIAGIIALLDVLLSIVLIVGCVKKNLRLLKYYYRHIKVMTILTTIWSLYNFGADVYILFIFSEKFPWAMYAIFKVIQTIVCFTAVALHIYILLLVRSQIIIVDEESQFKVLNNATDIEVVTDDKDSTQEAEANKGKDDDNEINTC